MPKFVPDHLWLYAYLLEPVASLEIAQSLQRILETLAPRWCKQLTVLKHDHDRQGIRVAGQSLLAALEQRAPVRRGLGSWALRGSYPDISIHLESCRTSYPPELNTITIEIYRMTTVEEQPAAQWLRDVFRALVEGLPVRYGNVRSTQEYDASNIEESDDGIRAIGCDFHVSLPGLYWLNYFGPEHVQLIGLPRLLSSPALESAEVGDGVLIRLASEPNEWNSPTYRSRKLGLLDHLGREYFFDRDNPHQPHCAPDFDSRSR